MSRDFSLTQGFALRTPAGTILGHSYRETATAAISSIWDQAQPVKRILWEERQAEGWCVVPVKAHVVLIEAATRVVPTEAGRPAA